MAKFQHNKKMDSTNTSDQSYTVTNAERCVRLLYSLALTLLIPLVLLHMVYRSFKQTKAYRQRFAERLGLVPSPPARGGLLVHCVSVGEVVAASGLLKRLLAQNPTLTITVTTATPTGSERLRQLFADRVHHFYLPFDLRICMSHMLRKVQPQQVLITEVELWPNLIHCCWRQRIPVSVINGRLTDRSRNSYQKMHALFYPMLRKVSMFCAQGQRDHDNYQQAGVPASKLLNTGNMKFDIGNAQRSSRHGQLQQHYNPQDRHIIVGGSTHDPEEKALLDAFSQLHGRHQDWRLLLVPRHPERFTKVWNLCQAYSLSSCRSSQGIHADADVVVIDEMGVLSELYGIANVAFIGGSLAPRGGHNALEACVFGVPVIMGPSQFNNEEICAILGDAGALQTVDSAQQLASSLETLITDVTLRERLGQQGKDIIEANRGAIARTQQALAL